MGTCVSTPADTESKKIDVALKADGKLRKLEVKLLLLGAGEAGKTTVIKQMKLMHASGFSAPEREAFRVFVFSNMVSAMQAILQAMADNHIALSNNENEKYLSIFAEMPRVAAGVPYPPEYQEAIKSLWSDPSVQMTYNLGHTFALADNVKYFFDAVDRLYKPDYVPDDADILRCRVKSTGITETTFHIGSLTYRMFDVGGQRSERKKWIHCFEGVTAVLFLVAISGYDQCLVEDKDANQMQEAMMLFDQICNSQWFIDTSMIMFMNKTDIFREKIKYSKIGTYFPDYNGREGDYHDATEFFQVRFMRLNRSEHKVVYVHFTDATNTNMLRNIMASVNDIILSRNVKVLVL
ncbi:guanine nucleotide binding protein, alpha subunit [Lobosporangium transversale]|uniref:Guanine nucleotide binding protein, alpha subunit n=1 Tax=Lobosporangium transversale TaxID=64571 RepID=A0A1Y2GVJ5_9FUNG|nr:guanine nucleotide binding protein, alpha subunit [Lobosporangium transversale]ORZ26326.1 guanine nucleotide binding protein, alpha subunit [Lobosporangium transversale]|eukprot:XP_021884091.1 guanine nucleotide binding protein, alpha subunit [Lobosporangium transversale]